MENDKKIHEPKKSRRDFVKKSALFTGGAMLLPNMQKLLNEKIGINYETVNSATHADIGRVDRALTSDERQYFQNMVNNIYNDFISIVADGRNMSKEMVDSIGQGRVWTAKDAQGIGLVDVIGSLDDAIKIAAYKADIKEYSIKSLPKMKSPSERILQNLNGIESSYLKSKLGKNYLYFEQLERIQRLEGTQMLLPYDIKID